MHLMDIEHREHEHESGTKHSMKRLYQRKKVNGKYQYSAVGWLCPECGTMVKN
jgi:rubrerythrin